MTGSPVRIATILLTALVSGSPAAAPAGPVGQKMDAAAMLVAARNAIGGDAKIRGLKALRLTGSVWASQWVIGGRVETLETPMEVRWGFPSRFLRISVSPLAAIESRKGFDGGRAISTTNGKPTGGRPSTRQAAELLLLVLARTESWGGLVFDAIGPHAIQVKGSDGYAARLEFDAASRLPARLIYRERRQIRLPRNPSGGSAGQARGGGGGGGGGLSTADLPEVEMTVELHDRRAVDGLLLPSRISTSAQGVKLGELRFDEIVVNPPLTAADFAP